MSSITPHRQATPIPIFISFTIIRLQPILQYTATMSDVPTPFIQTAIDCADKARIITQKWFRSQFDVATKQDRSPVTVADQETEKLIRDVILNRHPEHSFLGEESGSQTNDSPWQWIVDPIDGTKSFATGNPTFGTLISLTHHHKPVLGIIDHSILNERWVGIAGQPTTHNGMPCITSQCTDINAATLYATTPDMFDEDTVDNFDRLSHSCRFRVFGGDCYAYGLLASGFTDLVCEADLKPYDLMALINCIEGAGGTITDWQGRPLSLESDGRVLAAANHILHSAAIEVLNAN